MAALTRYADDRARYDTTYIRDVYESLEAASSQFKLPANTTWPGVATALRDVRACLSIDANTTCKITPDARDAFGTYASKLRLQVAMASDVVDAFSSEADAYQQRVEGAFATMTAFYDAFHTWYSRLNVIEIDPPGALFDVGREDFYAYPGAWPDGLAAPSGGSTRRSCGSAPRSLFSSSSNFLVLGSWTGSVGSTGAA